ncbi:MAG: bifunctional 5,10-methylenetetrahydrofolate dehydrogenase/5,10-methenyltetrahydrofolate cyclohydrolase, partial [Clostridiales Family XIII bacterium]|nr:bifunctional 5,10-methylenetetrahydrofolate dehydrogenase/5,10-methenyltetrahydrofolate cyclohydrolase [Clostridiales Family XIII bacterium]
TDAGTDADTEARAQALQGRLRTLAEDGSVHGILPFLPLPDGMDEAAALAEIPAGKDVDGMGPGAQAAVYEGRLLTEGRAFAPCTAESVMRLLDHYAIDVAGRHAVVVGRSAVIGRPVSQLLLARHATVTICHTRTQDLAQFTKAADILVVCAGLASSGAGSGITARHLRAGQTVVDVGIHRDGAGDLYGDVDAQAALGLVADLTPVPGGVGAMTTPILLEHVVRAAEQQGAARPLT